MGIMSRSPVFIDSDSVFVTGLQLTVWIMSIIGFWFVWKRLDGYVLMKLPVIKYRRGDDGGGGGQEDPAERPPTPPGE